MKLEHQIDNIIPKFNSTDERILFELEFPVDGLFLTLSLDGSECYKPNDYQATGLWTLSNIRNNQFIAWQARAKLSTTPPQLKGKARTHDIDGGRIDGKIVDDNEVVTMSGADWNHFNAKFEERLTFWKVELANYLSKVGTLQNQVTNLIAEKGELEELLKRVLNVGLNEGYTAAYENTAHALWYAINKAIATNGNDDEH